MKRIYIPMALCALLLVLTIYLVWARFMRESSAGPEFKLLPTAPTESTIIRYSKPRPVPEISFINGRGARVHLADFRGKVVLLNVWATWCFPCREEMPSLDRLQARLGGPDFLVLPLSTDREGINAVKAFYADVEISRLGIFVDPTAKSATDLKIVGYPTTFLIDRNGLARGVKLGAAKWDNDEIFSQIRKLINEPQANSESVT